MKWNEAFIYTLREDPAEAELKSHILMTRAGMIMKVASGIYNYLPLGLRVIRKVEEIIREEMRTVGVAELLMPGVIPADLWRESGRWDYYGKELLRLKDRKDNEFCLGPTHEEVIVDVARRSIKSYKHLPASLYQFQSKFRDEIRPRFGLMRGREFIMKDAYSFHASEECLDEMYWKMHHAYSRIFSRMGLNFRPVEADSGAIGGDVTHEFHVLADSGEDKIIYCTSCEYAANVEKAKAKRPTDMISVTKDLPSPTAVETPNAKTIEEVSSFLQIPSSTTIKMIVFQIDDDQLVAVLIRGDLELNEVKLRNHFQSNTLETPSEEILREYGLAVGYLGPIDFPADIPVVADFSLTQMTTAVVGANRESFHTTGIVPARDLSEYTYGDFAVAGAGESCPHCEGTLAECRGTEVGQVFKLGTKYSASMKMSFLDAQGKAATPTMGCYGIGVGRTAAASVEQHSDDDGIIWPKEIAPYHVHILSLDPQKEAVATFTQTLHDELESQNIDTLLDDRSERPGIKFKDADLIGCPVQIIVGGRSIKSGEIEIKIRHSGERISVALDSAVSEVISQLDRIA